MATRTELTLPNDPSVLPMARAYVREVATLAELSPEATTALVDAAEEACANVLQHAFAPCECGTFTLAGEISPVQVILSIRDRGVPFDPSLEGGAASVHPGHGLQRIREAVDEAHWLNHGPEGKELRLVKYRPHAPVTEQLPADQL